MNVKLIVLAYLEQHGFDGLYAAHDDCGCQVSDLMPCNAEGIDGCRPGYRVPCHPDESESGYDWRISETKPETFSISCPCCGDEAWVGTERDLITDGDPLQCGCKGHLSCDSENEPHPFVVECECGR